MRQFSDVELRRIKILTENSVELTFIEPTETGLQKSIMDATGLVRNFLRQKNIHDFNNQKQGPDHKVLANSFFIDYGKYIQSSASLYRPITKKGDPRIWFKGLNSYAKPNDILGIFEFQGKLYVINITTIDIERLINITISNPLQEIVQQIKASSNNIANELLNLIKNLASRGPIPAVVKGDTAVGRTLETILNIDINCSKKPDYKGIELKSFRGKKTNRKNLFAQVPDWPLSILKSSGEILQNFGYSRGDDFKLYCTVSSLVKNSQGLKLKINTDLNKLIEYSVNDKLTRDLIVWKLESLHKRLLEKHNETFWVSASSVYIDNIEHFTYKEIEHTRRPIISQFDILLEQGIITLDHLIKKTPDNKVVEKGPLFKIKPKCLGLLFPPSMTYNLQI